jgi:hypothetical protein
MSLYEDGTFIYTKVDSPLLFRDVNSDRMTVKVKKIPSKKLARIKGLLEDFMSEVTIERWEGSGTTDLPTTTIEVNLGDRSKTLSAYALMPYLEGQEFSVKEKIPEPIEKLYYTLVKLKSMVAKDYEPRSIRLLIAEVNPIKLSDAIRKKTIFWACSVSIDSLVSRAKQDAEGRFVAIAEGTEKDILINFLNDKTYFSALGETRVFEFGGRYFNVFYRPLLPFESA